MIKFNEEGRFSPKTWEDCIKAQDEDYCIACTIGGEGSKSDVDTWFVYKHELDAVNDIIRENLARSDQWVLVGVEVKNIELPVKDTHGDNYFVDVYYPITKDFDEILDEYC